MAGKNNSAQTIPSVMNLFLALFHTVINVYQFFILPLWLLPWDLRWGWTLLPLALLSNPFWSLIHEAIHDLFDPRRAVNQFFGRVLAIAFGSPFRILRLSHLLHHKLNRTPIEGTELYDPQNGSVWLAGLGYYFQVLGGLYLIEFASPLLFFLPRRLICGFRARFLKSGSVSDILMQNWTQRDAIHEIRLDGVLGAAWLGGSLVCYGGYWTLWLAMIAARGFLISFLDNVYHYRTPVNDIFYAKNLYLPPIFASGLLHFNLHGIHHQNPAIPWIHLPGVFARDGWTFQENYFVAAAKQLAGPVGLEELAS
jgi:fatty acid desaturase